MTSATAIAALPPEPAPGELLSPASQAQAGGGGGRERPAPSRGSFALAVDELVVARARRGDLMALEQLYRLFSTPVHTLARRLCRTRQDAEDVLQETFLELVRSISRFRGEGSFAGWVRRIAASKALMRLRSQGAFVFTELSPAEGEFAAGAFERLAVAPRASIERVDLETALDTLTDTARAVLWLHDVEGYSHDEIAAMTGKSASFSKSQLARSHARLRALLAPPEEGEQCT
ncbi:MAG: RNA polymerase sigma factor [Acidobacteriota bacterium]